MTVRRSVMRSPPMLGLADEMKEQRLKFIDDI